MAKVADVLLLGWWIACVVGVVLSVLGESASVAFAVSVAFAGAFVPVFVAIPKRKG